MATDERANRAAKASVAKTDGSNEDKPPFFDDWRGMYAFVLGTLAVLVAALSVITWLYR